MLEAPDPTLLGIGTALVGAIGALVTLLFKALIRSYERRIEELLKERDERIDELSAERDRYRTLLEASQGELTRNAHADERALALLSARLMAQVNKP